MSAALFAEDAGRQTVIRERLEPQVPPGLEGGALAGLMLRRATPRSGLSGLVCNAAPYWAHVWGGGLALARHLRAHPDLVRGRTVLDLGTGGGLVAIASAMLGAAAVTGVDNDPWAVSAARVNADDNGVDVSFSEADAATAILPRADIVLAGDLFYEARLAKRTLFLLQRLAGEGAEVLVGDPGRATLPLERLVQVAHYPVADFGGGPMVAGGIYRLA